MDPLGLAVIRFGGFAGFHLPAASPGTRLDQVASHEKAFGGGAAQGCFLELGYIVTPLFANYGRS